MSWSRTNLLLILLIYPLFWLAIGMVIGSECTSPHRLTVKYPDGTVVLSMPVTKDATITVNR